MGSLVIEDSKYYFSPLSSSMVHSGSGGLLLAPNTTQAYLEEILSWTTYKKSDLASFLRIARASLYNYLDGGKAIPEHHNKIVHFHTIATNYLALGGQINEDFMTVKLSDGRSFLERLESKEEKFRLDPEERNFVSHLVERNKKIDRSRKRMREKFGT